MEHEDRFEKVSEDEVAEVAHQLVEIPLEVQLGLVADNPESPSLSPPSPSLELPSPPLSPYGDLPSFMGFYILDDLAELEQWAVDSRAAKGNPELRGGIAQNFSQLEGVPPSNVGPTAVETQVFAPVRGSPPRTVEGLPGWL